MIYGINEIYEMFFPVILSGAKLSEAKFCEVEEYFVIKT
jgi:hypothetical protein